MEGKIENLMNMGFERDKCIQALRASFGNEERAVEYLVNRMPAEIP